MKKAKGGLAAAVSPAVDGPAKTPSGVADAELDLSAILPQFALALRAVLPPSSYIPSNILQSFAVAYCIFVLPGRPTSLLHPEAILENLIQDAPSTLKMIIGGLIVVQLYFGGQAKRWWDAGQNAGKAAREEMWKALLKLHEEGKAKAIGVSNFGKGHIESLKSLGSVWPPHVNQIEVSSLMVMLP